MPSCCVLVGQFTGFAAKNADNVDDAVVVTNVQNVMRAMRSVTMNADIVSTFAAVVCAEDLGEYFRRKTVTFASLDVRQEAAKCLKDACADSHRYDQLMSLVEPIQSLTKRDVQKLFPMVKL